MIPPHLPLRSVDAYTYKHQDFVVFAAAGNYGKEDHTYLRYGDERGSMMSPGSAKNAVGVGSHKNLDGSLLNKKGKRRKKMAYLSDFSSRCVRL